VAITKPSVHTPAPPGGASLPAGSLLAGLWESRAMIARATSERDSQPVATTLAPFLADGAIWPVRLFATW